ncbi:MAG: hypothetical protein PVI65_09940, partial [Desulfobacterales bacterium]
EGCQLRIHHTHTLSRDQYESINGIDMPNEKTALLGIVSVPIQGFIKSDLARLFSAATLKVRI